MYTDGYMADFALDLPRIKDIERKARQGDSGAARRVFVRRYREMLDAVFAEIRAASQNYMDSLEGNISCVKGCTHCCEHFVSVTVSHALVVTDYLYASEKAFSTFLRNYGPWLAAIRNNPQSASLFKSLESYTAGVAEVQSPPQELVSAYHLHRVPCPFLDGIRCSIYAVRPICCAAYFAVSPPECCQAQSEMPAAIFEVTPSQANLRKLAGLSAPRLSLHQESLPQLVYKLLADGLPEVAQEVERLFKSQEQEASQT